VTADGLAVVAVDVGGTSLKAGILGPAGLRVLRRVASGRESGPDAVLDTVTAVVARLVEECSDLDVDVAGVGVVVPGIVDANGVGRFSVTMGWRDLPIRQHLSERLARPVAVGHDVRTAGVAEATFGAAAAARSALFVPIGTGLAAALIVDGEVRPGATLRAGEIGQVLVAPETTLEHVASARAIAERYAAAAGRPLDEIDAAGVVALVASGDDVAAAVWSDAVAALAGVLAAAIALVDVEMLVLGGGLARAGDALTAPLAAALAAALPWRDVPPLVTARFGADAGFVGAALEAWRHAGRDVGELTAAIETRVWDTAEAVPADPAGQAVTR
jgi:glucokinase